MHYNSFMRGSDGNMIKDIIVPLNTDYKDFIDSGMMMTPEDILSLNYHFGCETISTKVVQDYLRGERTRIKRDLKQFEITPSDATRRYLSL